MTRLPVYILAGGRSSRFGSDKARALIHGKPLLRHVATMLDSIASDVTVVADRDGKYNDLGFRTIADRQPGLGPLAGLQMAIEDLPTDHHWLMLCVCDAVVIRRSWLDALLVAQRAQVEAVAFRGSHWQPMPALYSRDALPTVLDRLQTNHRSMQLLLNHLRVAAITLPNDWPEIWQVNTPKELAGFRSAH